MHNATFYDSEGSMQCDTTKDCTEISMNWHNAINSTNDPARELKSQVKVELKNYKENIRINLDKFRIVKVKN